MSCERKYRPSNGTEGDGFHENFCFQCLHERWVHRQEEDRDEDKCIIMNHTLLYQVDDPRYPSEWTYDDKGNPTCTKFVKFDWGTDDDPREPGPDIKPPLDDPMQLLMPFGMSELFGSLWGDEVVVTKTAIIEREVLEEMQRA